MTGVELLTVGGGVVGGGITSTAALNAALASGVGLGTIGAETVGTTVTLGNVLAAGNAIGSAASAFQKGQAAKAQADFQATMMRQQADRERQQAAIDAEDFGRQQSAAMATRRAGMGASGVEAGSGSPLLVAEDFAGESALQRLRIGNGGAVKATRLEQSAALQNLSGRNDAIGGALDAVADLGTGLARVGSQIFDRTKPGKKGSLT